MILLGFSAIFKVFPAFIGVSSGHFERGGSLLVPNKHSMHSHLCFDALA
jgi:hypothetical protein